MVDLRPDYLSIVLAILKAEVPHCGVWAFGSRAKWTARDSSDLDLAIISARQLPLSKLGRLRQALADSYLPLKVDILDFHRISPEFREVIKGQYVVLQEGVAQSDSTLELQSQWQSLTIEDCMETIIDYRGKTPHKISSGIPLITAKVVKNGRIETPDEFISPEDYDGWMRRGLPREGDVLLTMEAPLGEVAQLDHRKVALAQRLVALRGKTGLLDNTFLLYALQSEPVRAQLRSRATGTTVLGIRQSELRKINLPIPPLPLQKSIAQILRVLDDKIELNRRMNATLEAMARALFQSWFVDFDPVRDKLDDRPTAALFPNCFERSEGGHIPKGWTIGKVSDVVSLNRDAINPGNFPTEIFDHFSLPAFDNGRTPKVEIGSAIMSNKFTVTPNSVLLSKLNPHIPRIWLPDLQPSRRSICSTEFMVACAKPRVSREYLYSLFTSSVFASIYGTLVTGTTGSHQRIRPESVLDMKIVCPPIPLIRNFSEIVKPMFDRINRNTDQSCTLATLRSSLLPKLLSGELTVYGAE